VAFQGALGAFTVLGLLAPGTVTAHLLTALLLVLVVAGCSDAVRALGSWSDVLSAPPLPRWWWPFPTLATALLFSQCFLGGAMASRWASSLCLESGEGCRWLLLHRFGAWGALTALFLLGAASLALPKGHRPVAIRAVAAGGPPGHCGAPAPGRSARRRSGISLGASPDPFLLRPSHPRIPFLRDGPWLALIPCPGSVAWAMARPTRHARSPRSISPTQVLAWPRTPI
jgi:hypothetical protein